MIIEYEFDVHNNNSVDLGSHDPFISRMHSRQNHYKFEELDYLVSFSQVNSNNVGWSYKTLEELGDFGIPLKDLLTDYISHAPRSEDTLNDHYVWINGKNFTLDYNILKNVDWSSAAFKGFKDLMNSEIGLGNIADGSIVLSIKEKPRT